MIISFQFFIFYIFCPFIFIVAFVRVVSVPIENVYSKNTNDDGVCTIVWTQFHFSFPNFVSSDQMVKYDLLHIYHTFSGDSFLMRKIEWRFIDLTYLTFISIWKFS